MISAFHSRCAGRSRRTWPAAGARPTAQAFFLFTLLSVMHCFVNSVTIAAQGVLYLDERDSITVIQRAPIYVRGRMAGLRLDYVAIDPLSDTDALRSRALSIFTLLRPALDSLGTTALVVHATEFAPTSSTSIGTRSFRGYGYVIKRASDGKWYFNGSSSPIPDSVTHGVSGRPKADRTSILQQGPFGRLVSSQISVKESELSLLRVGLEVTLDLNGVRTGPKSRPLRLPLITGRRDQLVSPRNLCRPPRQVVGETA